MMYDVRCMVYDVCVCLLSWFWVVGLLLFCLVCVCMVVCPCVVCFVCLLLYMFILSVCCLCCVVCLFFQGTRRFFAASSSCIRKSTLDSNVAWLVSRHANFKVLFLASDNHVAYDLGLPKNMLRKNK
jgi:hypothetical protein